MKALEAHVKAKHITIGFIYIEQCSISSWNVHDVLNDFDVE